jgi:energy-coupling factor transporter ATP-binding protein EcfA2
MNEETDVFVETTAFHKAVSQLDQHSLLLLQGPSASGKSTLVRALLRHFQAKGFTPLVLHRYEEWRHHVDDDRKQIVFLDGIFGDVCLDQAKFADWSKLFSSMVSYPAATAKRLVIVVMYTHVTKEIEGMGEAGMGTLFQHSLDLQRVGQYTDDEKRELVLKHTRKVPSLLDTDSLMAEIQAVDKSGPAFPWCARRFCQLLLAGVTTCDAMTVFSSPEMALAAFFMRALSNKDNGPVMAAMLLLTLKGDCFAP